MVSSHEFSARKVSLMQQVLLILPVNYDVLVLVTHHSTFRNPKRKIVPSISLLGSRIAAFDDVNVDDRDFEAIQGKRTMSFFHFHL